MVARLRPQLSPAVALQRRTVGAQLDLLEALAPTLAAAPAPAESVVLDRLADGLPVLRAELAPLPFERLTPAMRDLCRAIEAATGYLAARRVAEALEGGAVDPARLLALVCQRDEAGVGQMASDAGLVLDVLWLVADLTAAPAVHLHQLAALRDRQPDSPVREALERWGQGFCPACGSWPVLAQYFFGERLPTCGFCGCLWRLKAEWCVYCTHRGERFRTIVPQRGQTGRRLELCRACGGYLKTIDVEALTPFPLLAIEDLATSDLDQAARHHGFRRMALRRQSL